MSICIYVCMYVCMYVYTYVCMYVCMYVCIRMNIRMYICMYVYVCMYVSEIAEQCIAGYGIRGLLDLEDLPVPGGELLRLAQLPGLHQELPQLRMLAGTQIHTITHHIHTYIHTYTVSYLRNT